MQQATATKVKSCKEMGGATFVMPVITGAFSQWADTIDITTAYLANRIRPTS